MLKIPISYPINQDEAIKSNHPTEKTDQNQNLQEISNGFHSGSLVDPNFVAPHNELLLIRQPILRQAPQPQPVRQRPTLRFHPASHRAVLVRHDRHHRKCPEAGRAEPSDAAPPPARANTGGAATEAALGEGVNPVQPIARKLEHFCIIWKEKEGKVREGEEGKCNKWSWNEGRCQRDRDGEAQWTSECSTCSRWAFFSPSALTKSLLFFNVFNFSP